MHELPDLSRPSISGKDALIVALFEQVKQVARLTALVQTLSARVQELEGQLRKNSRNSSKPPSSDGLAKKPKSLRQSCGRKPGGQPGHPGITLERTASPDVIVQHRLPECCEGCGARLDAQADAMIEERRQVFDLVQPVLQVTEHRGYEMLCHCGQRCAHTGIAGVTRHDACKAGPRHILHHLRKQRLARIHEKSPELSTPENYPNMAFLVSNRHQTKSPANPHGYSLSLAA